MAVRKKVRTVTVLPVDGGEHETKMTTTALYAMKRVNVMIAGRRHQMYYTSTHFVGSLRSLGLSPVNFNKLATNLCHTGDHKGRAPSLGEVVVGDAYVVDPAQPHRYVRVVSIKPVRPFGTPGCVRDSFVHFEEWAEDQFPEEHRPYPLYDPRGLYVACEHPDYRIRDSWLAACRLRWG